MGLKPRTQKHLNDFHSWITKNEEFIDGKVLVMNYVSPMIDWYSTVIPIPIFKKILRDNTLDSKLKRQKKLLIRTKEKVERLEEQSKELTDDDLVGHIDFKGEPIIVMTPGDKQQMIDEMNNMKIRIEDIIKQNEAYKRELHLIHLDSVLNKKMREDEMSLKDDIKTIKEPTNVVVENVITMPIAVNLTDDGKLLDLNIKRSMETKIPIQPLEEVIKKYYLNEMRMSDLMNQLEKDIKDNSESIKEIWYHTKMEKGRTMAIKTLIEYYKQLILQNQSEKIKYMEMCKNLMVKFRI